MSLGTRQLVTFLRAKSAKNGYCWWKQKTIAKDMERGLRTVNRQIAEACAAGLLKSERHGHGNYYTPCDLIEKVAYREATVEKPAMSAAVGVSDTPNWRIVSPPVSITEILKPERNLQSECTVQEHPEPDIASIEPSSYEKAQTEAIVQAVRWCGFEPTPELLAKLARKRRFFGATGFEVGAAITRAFKLVEGTSNTPQTGAWITTVVENALKAKAGGPGTSVRKSSLAETSTRTENKPAGTWPHPPAEIEGFSHDQAPGQGQGEAPVQGSEIARVGVQATQIKPTCLRCQNFGVRQLAADSDLHAWCECARGDERRTVEPAYVERVNAAIVRNRRFIRPIVPVAQPRPPQRALVTAADVLPTARLEALG